jgi:ribonuclease HI
MLSEQPYITNFENIKKTSQNSSILSLNCAKSISSTTFILQYAAQSTHTIALCLQEPGLDHNREPPSHDSFICFSPGKNPKCCTYIRLNQAIQATPNFQHNSSFLGCRIKVPNFQPFTLYNIYSTGGRDTAFANLIKTFQPEQNCIMIGDFNCHHPWWFGNIKSTKNNIKSRSISVNANSIVEWLEDNAFVLHNAPGVGTHYPRGTKTHRPTVIDLSFSRGTISEKIDQWIVDHDSTSDHSITGLLLSLPIDDQNIATNELVDRYRAWSRADWTTFGDYLSSKNMDFSNIGSKEETQRAIDSLYTCIQEGLDKAVPIVSKKSKYAPWWSANLTWLTTKLKRARQRFRNNPSTENEKTVISSKITWEHAIKNAKNRHWKMKLENLNQNEIWTVQKKHSRVHTRGIPDLDGASAFIEKCNKLRSTLFPTPEIDELEIPDDFVGSNADMTDTFFEVSRAEIIRALDNSNRNSAVGIDQITYKTLIQLDEAVPSVLPLLATAVFKYGYHHEIWKQALCVVIPKQGKPSYDTAKSYRPISLLSCFGKLIEKIAAQRIEKAGIICGAITKLQFGNKEGHSAIDALFHTLSQITPHIGRQSPRGYCNTIRPSLAAHDILGAFNNTRPEILVRIMEIRRMPKYLVEWVRDFTNNRTLAFSFDGCKEEPQPFLHSIPQGSPVSPVLFSIIFSAVMDGNETSNIQSASAYMDDMVETYADVNIGAVTPILSNSFMIKSQRAAKIGLKFAPEKSEVIHFSTKTRSTTKYDEHLTINHSIRIMPSNVIKLLGVNVDETLKFFVHAQYAASQARQSLGKILYLRKGSHGISPKIARYLAISFVLPKMFWASPIWWTGSQSVIGPLENTYNRIARWITGLPRTTRISKLLRCAHLPPLNLWLDYITRNYAIRLITLPADHSLRPLPTFDPSRTSVAGPHRILSFVSEYLDDRLEDRTHKSLVSITPLIIHHKKPQSDDEKKAAVKTHRGWIRSLKSQTIVIYTDGSRSMSSYIGAGWVIYQKIGDELRKTGEGHCALGNRMEVFDAELHAIYESLIALSISDNQSTPVYICVDNSAAIHTLMTNPNGNEAAYMVSKVAIELMKNSQSIYTIWLPSHCGIEGNETADALAKKGSQEENRKCPHAYTSLAWLKRKSKSQFIDKWREAMNDTHISWKYPEEWSNWSFRYARSIFQVYCGRTKVDPRHGEEAVMCKCQDAEISSKHILGQCQLFDRLRSRMTQRNELPTHISNNMVLEKEWGAAMRKFLEQTRLGFSENLRYETVKFPEQDDISTEEDVLENFEVGMFE